MTMTSFTPEAINSFFSIGRYVAPLYSFGMSARAYLYEKNILKSARLPVPVVCVGNLTMGGTGKTPMVMHLARLLSEKMNPAIISRGYGGRLKNPVNVISDGKNLFYNSFYAGDEPVLLAESLPGIPVVTGARRAITGKYLVDKKMADVLIMDDGFQHLALQRDLNLALFSAAELIGTGRVFPGGILRESLSALRRADAFVITGADESNMDEVDSFAGLLSEMCPETPLFKGKYVPCSLKRDADEQNFPLEKLSGSPLYAFCAIANPESFLKLLNKHFIIKDWQAFQDHHRFAGTELFTLAEKAISIGCKGLIVTEKDYVKIKGASLPLPLWIIKVKLEMPPEFDRFVWDKISMAKDGLMPA